MKRLIMVALLLAAIGAGCDANEPAIADGEDFNVVAVTLSGVNANVAVQFYDVIALNSFFLYFDVNGDNVADFLVRNNMNSNSFGVYEGSGTGSFNILRHSGSATIDATGKIFSYNFPVSAIDQDPLLPFDVGYWAYSMTSTDRAPDTGVYPFSN